MSARTTSRTRSRRTGGDEVLVVRDLVKRFKEVTAVDGVSFTVRKGEIFGLLGANGAGKTTTQRIISTILKPTSGSVEVLGKDVIREPEQVRASIGVITEETGLYDRLTARETLMFYGRLYGLGDDVASRRSSEVMKLLEMEDYADRRTEKLSKGMKQKIVIARALIHDPPILLFDEPTAGLDVLAARTVRDFIQKSRRMGKTVIYSTHIMFEAETMCENMVLIHKGKVVTRGSVDQVRGNHRNLEDAFIQAVRSGPVFRKSAFSRGKRRSVSRLGRRIGLARRAEDDDIGEGGLS
jgi:sodium transport system ATP-binding protein